MQGIEPKIHQEVMRRMNDLEQLLKESPDQNQAFNEDVSAMNAELTYLYEDYLTTKKKLENCIKLYRSRHIEIRKQLTQNIRKLRRETVLQNK
ncbi:hypothetical protein [Chryseobacterium populi]|uniref:Uncharacterized protein n=1 Tax=Chryseobacterium populi TaxID=1144316 RepID=J3CBJ7_9FLAO|nr:hypothetical protein [Chryseobacterium populi]EJL68146.1 hypothetical protein PMI13_03901 [Chryseobacterium populi]